MGFNLKSKFARIAHQITNSLCEKEINLPLQRPTFYRFLNFRENKKAKEMASNYVEGETEGKFDRHHLSPRQAPSPRTMSKSWSGNSLTYSHGSNAQPKCVCAPATHANSFKCRLHRTPPGPTSPTAHHSKPPPAVSNNTAHRTVETQ